MAREDSKPWGLILGSGAEFLDASLKEQVDSQKPPQNRWGVASSAIVHWKPSLGANALILLRHGSNHDIPPHKVNYRANLKALSDADVKGVIAIGAVGALTPKYRSSDLVLPDQLIDYTHKREQSFWEPGESMRHADFNVPFDLNLRRLLIRASEKAKIDLHDGGCYAVTEGPRLETAAELKVLLGQGNHMVGMTAMPEAALARELKLAYAMVNVVVNQCQFDPKHGTLQLDTIFKSLENGHDKVRRLVAEMLSTPEVRL